MKILNRNLRTWKEDQKRKSIILFKKCEIKTLKLHHHGILAQKLWKLKSHVTQNRTEKNNKHIPNKHRHMSLRLKICLVIGQLAVHGSQLRLELFNLPVQTANRSEHSVLLVPIVQEQVVTSEISDVSLQISNSSFQIVSLMLESHPLQQRLLVLFKVLTLAKPPVTNYSQSTPRKEKRKKPRKILQSYHHKI